MTDSFMESVASTTSRSDQRSAHASPRLIPVAAMTTSPDRYRMSRDSVARNIARTSSSVGARTGSGNSARVKTGSSVSVTGLDRVFPLHLRAKRQARWRTERE